MNQANGESIQVWTAAVELHPARLDSIFYNWTNIANDRRIKANCAWKPFRELASRIFKGAFCILQQEYANHGIPYLRTIEIKPGFVDLKKCVYLSPEIHERERRTAVRSNNVILAKTGASIGYSAVCPKHLLEANICQDLVGVRVHKQLDSHYLQAFLASQPGQTQTLRWCQGNAHPHLGLEGIREWVIPFPLENVQRAIGNRIRKSERLRELAVAAKRRASQSLDDLLQWPISLRAMTMNLVNPADATVQRLDAKFYLPAYLDTAKHIRSLKGGWRPLSDYILSIYNGAESRTFEEKGRPYLCVGNMADGLLDIDGAPKIPWNAELPEKALIQEGDLLIVRTGSLGQAANVRPVDAVSNAAISSHFIRLVLHEPALSAVLAFFLNSQPGKLLQEQIAYGAIQLQLSQDEVGELPIPTFSSRAAEQIGGDYRRWRDLLDESNELVALAKQAVETLIDGTLDEERLLAESAEIEAWLKKNPSPHEASSPKARPEDGDS